MRVQHAHGWGKNNDGGHYHYDVTPEEVQYLAYYNIAEGTFLILKNIIYISRLYNFDLECFRVDAPVETHQVGRD